ncbi:MAG: peptidase U32 family protein [Candidatus Rokuibacteriota bacterium]
MTFELTTSISSLRHLRESDLEPYDALYLGNLHCRRYEGNLLERPADLREAIGICRDLGRRAYLTTYAAVRQDALGAIRAAIETASAAGATAVEVHAPGLVKLVRDEFPGMAIHVGSFANVYTDLGVEVLKRFGVARIVPSHELTLDELDAMATAGGIPLESVVHGKVPLGVSDACILLDYETAWGVRCPDLCQRDVFLRRDDWGLKSVGTGILSGHDVCLLEHLPRLLAAGHRHFRIEGVAESPAYRRDIGQVYRAAIGRALGGEGRVDPGWWEVLRAHAKLGLCNGFAFGRSGMEYVGGPDA